MELAIDITGAGSCTGAGHHEPSTTVLLYAEPASGNLFKKFTINGIDRFEERYELTVGLDNLTVYCFFYTTFELYIRGSVFFDVPDAVLNNIRIARGIKYQADSGELSKAQLNLAYADTLMYGATRPSTIGGIKDSDGGWSHSEGGVSSSSSDKIFLRTRALDIYKLYGEDFGSTRIKLGTLNGTPFHGRF